MRQLRLRDGCAQVAVGAITRIHKKSQRNMLLIVREGGIQRLAASAANDVGELFALLLGVGGHLTFVGVADAEEVPANTRLKTGMR